MFMHPEQVLQLCQIAPATIIADFGAGSGFMSRAAATLAPQGIVYAIEIQRGLVERLQHDAKQAGFGNVHPIWGNVEAPGGSSLKEGSIDFVIFSNILFQLDDKQNAVSEAARVLKSGGRVLVVDWTDSFGGMGPAPHHVFGPAQAQAVFEQKGFTVANSTLPAGEHHYAILFSKK